ncbi:MAG: succinate dehydrogenase, cytochrome b556 subunit [Chloroflexi bacterium]|nr:succinate dehydrogenase, cytochrome b556 subunit [Chloroflexota bacterium]
MATFISTLWEGVRYRGGIGNWAYLFHRLAGLATLLFLAIHIVDTAFVFFAPSLYAHAIDIYRSTPFMFGEIALVAGVLFHGANGLKIIVFDYRPDLWSHENEKRAAIIVFAVTIILWIPAAIIMGNNLIQCNFLHLCGE